MTPSRLQPGILAPVPAHGRHLAFALRDDVDTATLREALAALANAADGLATVVGIGPGTAARLGRPVPGLHAYAPPEGARVALPVTQADLWLWLRGDTDAGELLHRGRTLAAHLAPAYDGTEARATFRHREGRDLTGYVDGTENPQDDAAVEAAAVTGQGEGLDGGSFVAVQPWEHALARFDALTPQARDHAIGRRLEDDEELDDAPPSAHVRRTAQESFDPEAFVVRRSMPWSEGSRCGLMFVAFASRLDPFEAQLARMAGAEDGIIDALFGFSQPTGGACYWCPPSHAGRIDLGHLLAER